ncbi:hypothetical protein [Nocardioides sp. LML1-1-1.1]|uniref:hypothetical protein n=1 Tax=Nocardioides sp. LML1-1-1.1 TaxID=3135248 RepID=UPI003428A40A
MPFPAYEGLQFFFKIVIGMAWRQEFAFIDRNTGEAAVWEPGWKGLFVIRDDGGRQVARLDQDGTAGGADGLVTFADGMVALDLPAAFTAGLAATTTYVRVTNKPFLFGDLTLTDPTAPTEPYLAASGKGISYLPTTIGA